MKTFAKILILLLVILAYTRQELELRENRRMIQQNTKWDAISRMKQAEHIAEMFDELREMPPSVNRDKE